jgi:hypothetical protein
VQEHTNTSLQLSPSMQGNNWFEEMLAAHENKNWLFSNNGKK